MKCFTLIIFFFVLLAKPALSQYLPNSSQTFQYASWYNPAFAGIEPYGDLTLGYRRQWVGFGAGAPGIANIVYNGRLNQPLDLRHNAMRTSSSGRRSPWRKRIMNGFDVHAFHEETGPFKRQGGGITYSIHFPVSEKIHVAGGGSLTARNVRVDMSEIYLGSNADPDPLLEGMTLDGSGRTDLNFQAGLLLYSRSAFVGFSYLPVWNGVLEGSRLDLTEDMYRGTMQAGVIIPVGLVFDLRPSVQTLFRVDQSIETDYNIKVCMRDVLWFGLTYRDIESVAGLVGFDISKLLIAMYSYEVSTNRLRQFNDGSHELVLSLRFNNLRENKGSVW